MVSGRKWASVSPASAPSSAACWSPFGGVDAIPPAAPIPKDSAGARAPFALLNYSTEQFRPPAAAMLGCMPVSLNSRSTGDTRLAGRRAPC
jgi:hypothetical protein